MPANRVSQTYTSGATRDEGGKEYRAEYIVHMTSGTEGAGLAYVAPGVPRLGDSFGPDPIAKCRRIECADQDGDPSLFRIMCYFSTKASNAVDDPINAPAEIEWSGQTRSVDMLVAKRVGFIVKYHTGQMDPILPAPGITGNDTLDAVRCTNLMPYVDSTQYEKSDLILRYTRNQKEYSSLFYFPYFNAVNSAFWYGFAPGVAQCKNISATRLPHPIEPGFYWQLYFEIAFRPEGWGNLMQEAGYYERGPAGRPRQIRDENRDPIAAPAMLDTAGHKINESDPADSVFSHYQPYRAQNFVALGLEL